MTCRGSTRCWATGAAATPARPASAWPRARPAASDRVDDCSGVNPPSGKKGTYAMPCRAKSSIRASSLAIDHVVVVLHAHNVGDRLRLCYLGGRDVAQTDVADQPLAPEVSQHRHLLGDGLPPRGRGPNPSRGS